MGVHATKQLESHDKSLSHSFSISPFLSQVYMYQLFRSLAYIHSQGVCHRDIKPQNLLVDPDTAVLKLCDFGRCVHVSVLELDKLLVCLNACHILSIDMNTGSECLSYFVCV